jgi:hypothetical protein
MLAVPNEFTNRLLLCGSRSWRYREDQVAPFDCWSSICAYSHKAIARCTASAISSGAELRGMLRVFSINGA